jgi:DNA ligase 1
VRDFAALFAELDASTATGVKVAALVAYLGRAAPADAAWATYLLAGGKPRQVVPTALLRRLACETAGIDDWLFDECYQAVGDLAETIAHVLPPAAAGSDQPLSVWMEERLLPLRGQPPERQAECIRAWWSELDTPGRFLLTKLIGGGFRVGVSRLLVQRAMAEVSGLDAKLVAQRMMGWTDARRQPDAARYAALMAPEGSGSGDVGQPYPFFLAHPLDRPVEVLDAELGPPSAWIVEWKYDGIRAQVVRRSGEIWIWSRGEELVTERFPEIVASLEGLPDGCVLDGEIVVFDPTDPLTPAPFTRLQQRIGRKTLTRRILAEVPVGFMAYDLLEAGGVDLRSQTQAERRRRLEALAVPLGLRLSPCVEQPDWPALAALRQTARERRVEGFMLKHRESVYGIGRRREAGGGWLKWKVEPMTVDAVLVYAQAGHGRRASLYTDYTFAVWNRAPASADEAAEALQATAARDDTESLQLVPVAKAYSGLTDDEIRQVDQVIRRTTREKFGPVRSVQPTLVFELGFEGINASPRHKSGIALRFPRMLRLRSDKPLHEADCLATLRSLLG